MLGNITSVFLSVDFSLSMWMSEHGLDSNKPLEAHLRNDLLADLGLGAYLNERECTLQQAWNTNGWISGKYINTS